MAKVSAVVADARSSTVSMRMPYKKGIFVSLAVMSAIGVMIFVFERGLRPRNYLEIKVAFSHYNPAKSESVCSVTFSNASEAVIIAEAYWGIDYLSNGFWAQTSSSGFGAFSDLMLPHQAFQQNFSVPDSATAVRVDSCYEHIPRWREDVAGIIGKQAFWGWAWHHSRKIRETNWSDTLDITPFTNSAPRHNPVQRQLPAPDFRKLAG